MRIALTGASGFIGSALVRDLTAAGHTVTALVRSTSRRDHIEAADRFVVGDQADPEVWPALLEGADQLVHNAVDWAPLKPTPDLAAHLQANVAGAIRLMAAAAPRPVLFVSSVAVHHDIRPRWSGVIDGDHPTRPGSLYGAAKAAVEAFGWAAHANGQPFTAFRPCAVYGIDPRLDRSIGHPIIETLRRGEAYTRAGGGKFVHVDDVSAAIVAALVAPEAPGRAFDLVDCYARWSDWAGLTAELLELAHAEIDSSSPAAPRNVFDVSAAREILGVPLDRGHAGIRTHLQQLIERMPATATC